MKSSDLLPEDENLYYATIKAFAHSEYISTAKIQRIMQVSYLKADKILEIMVREGYASPRDGAKPCRVLRIRFVN